MKYLFDNSIFPTLYRSLEEKVESQGEEIVELKRADKVREGHITALQIEMKSLKRK